MPQFRKKPVVISAIKFLFIADDGDPVFVTNPKGWLTDAVDAKTVDWEDGVLFVNTLEGRMNVSPGDWLIRGVKNEIYACKPDIFEATYEPA